MINFLLYKYSTVELKKDREETCFDVQIICYARSKYTLGIRINPIRIKRDVLSSTIFLSIIVTTRKGLINFNPFQKYSNREEVQNI